MKHDLHLRSGSTAAVLAAVAMASVPPLARSSRRRRRRAPSGTRAAPTTGATARAFRPADRRHLLASTQRGGNVAGVSASAAGSRRQRERAGCRIRWRRRRASFRRAHAKRVSATVSSGRRPVAGTWPRTVAAPRRHGDRVSTASHLVARSADAPYAHGRWHPADGAKTATLGTVEVSFSTPTDLATALGDALQPESSRQPASRSLDTHAGRSSRRPHSRRRSPTWARGACRSPLSCSSACASNRKASPRSRSTTLRRASSSVRARRASSSSTASRCWPRSPGHHALVCGEHELGCVQRHRHEQLVPASITAAGSLPPIRRGQWAPADALPPAFAALPSRRQLRRR